MTPPNIVRLAIPELVPVSRLHEKTQIPQHSTPRFIHRMSFYDIRTFESYSSSPYTVIDEEIASCGNYHERHCSTSHSTLVH
jgi:hypothetical protein